MSTGASETLGLKKTLGFWTLFALAVGAVVGDGVFTFTGFGVATAGPSILFVYLGVGILQLFLMISFGELVVWKPTSGGPELWVRTLVGRNWGGVASLMFSLGWVFCGGSVGLAVGVYTHNFLAQLGVNANPADLWITLFSIGWLSLFAFLNVRGVAVAARAQLTLVLFLVGVMVVFSLSMLPHISGSNYVPLFPDGFGGMMRAIPIVAYAFVGASTVMFASEEAKRPRDVSRVLLWGSVVITVLYTFAVFCGLGVLGMGKVQKFMESLFVTAASETYGVWFANLLNVAAWAAAASCLLMGTIYQPPRDLYNLSRSGYRVPRWFGSLHPRYRTPVRATLLVWALAVVLVIAGQVWGQSAVYQLLGYEVVWVWCISWALTLWAALNFRRKYGEIAAGLPWRVPLWPVTPIIAIVGILVTVYALFRDVWLSYGSTTCIVFTLVSLAIVLVVWVIMQRIKPEEETGEVGVAHAAAMEESG